MMRRFLIFFSLLFSFFSYSCAQSVKNDFYLGLNSTNTQAAISYYEKALTGKNVFIRRSAAEELAVLMSNGASLSNKTMQKVRSEIHGTWKKAFDSVSDKNKSLDFLLNIDRDTPEEARRFVLRECGKNFLIFNNQEIVGINGHYQAVHFRYREALEYFRAFQQEDEWPVHLPDFLLKYPVLINDLGRAFQYTSTGSEGLNLFLQWEKNLIAAESYDLLKDVQFRLLFYAARIARRNGLSGQAAKLFEQITPSAPTPEQTDACIWYILDLAKAESNDLFLQKLEQFIPSWQNKNYYDDILEKSLQILTEKKDWDEIINLYNILKESNAPITAAYAFVISRVMEEGYETKAELKNKADFLNTAYDVSADNFYSMLYYRALTAAKLGKPLFSAEFTDDGKKNAGRKDNSSAMQFVTGFFTYNAEEHAPRYVRQLENEGILSVDELRACAVLLESAGFHAPVIRLVSRYMNREDYAFIERRDVELLFPRPFKEPVEKYAEITNIPPEILYGLIRTESAFQVTVVSRSNAVGLTQLIPATADEMANFIRRAGGPDYTGVNLNLDDPEQNIYIGAYYLSYLMERFNDMRIALLAYNGGMNRIRRFMQTSNLPLDLFMESLGISETRDYGRKVLGAAAVYKELYYKEK